MSLQVHHHNYFSLKSLFNKINKILHSIWKKQIIYNLNIYIRFNTYYNQDSNKYKEVKNYDIWLQKKTGKHGLITEINGELEISNTTPEK